MKVILAALAVIFGAAPALAQSAPAVIDFRDNPSVISAKAAPGEPDPYALPLGAPAALVNLKMKVDRGNASYMDLSAKLMAVVKSYNFDIAGGNTDAAASLLDARHEAAIELEAAEAEFLQEKDVFMANGTGAPAASLGQNATPTARVVAAAFSATKR